jgi:hypothetical protein
MMPDAQTLSLLRRHLEAENDHRLEETLATLHPDCVFEDFGLRRAFHGREGAGAYYREWWQALDVKVETGGMRGWTEDGVLLSQARFVGRHIGPFFGLPQTGRAIDLPFVVVVWFRDGLMAGERFFYNPAMLLPELAFHSIPAGTRL